MTRGFRDYYGGYTSPQGQGDIVFVSVAAGALAPNTDWIFTVPANERWRPISLFAQLTTDGTPGDRNLQLKISPSGGGIASYFAGILAGPGNTFDVNWASGFPMESGVMGPSLVRLHLPMPQNILLTAGGTLGSVTVFQGVADVWNNASPIGLLYERWAGLQ